MAVDIGTAVAYLNLDTTSFNQSLSAVQASIETFQRSTATIGQKISSVGSVVQSVGASLTKNLTIPLVNLGQSAIQNYRDFETAFTGVKKTMDESAVQQIGGWDVLKKAIEEMATQTASSVEDIAGVMEVAGQLGVPLGEAGKDVIDFTKTMVMLGDSTDLTSAEAAEALARFMNITGLTFDKTENLGSSIVDLGNNFATSESQIVNMATRLASAGTVAGLSETEILALSTAMSSVGIRAEAGGSAMATTLTQIEKIVRGVSENSSEKLQTLGKISGMTAEEFSKAWKNDPMTALTGFLYGLGKLEDQGESAVVMLDDLGMSGVRQTNMLKALALSGDNLASAIETANSAFNENIALSTEAEKRYGTLDSRINQLNERWKTMKRDIAEILIPVLEDLMGKLEKVMEWWSKLDDAQKRNIVRWAEIAAVIGPVLTIFGRLITSVGSVISIFTQLIAPIASAVSSAGSLGAEFGSIVSAAAPVIAIVAAVAAAIYSLIKSFGGIGGVIEDFKQRFERVKQVLANAAEFFHLKEAIDKLKEAFSTFLEKLGSMRNTWEVILKILEVVIEVVGVALVGAFRVVIDTITNVLTLLGDFCDFIEAVATLIVDVFTGNWGKLWEDVLNICQKYLKGVMDFLDLCFGWIIDLFKWLADVLVGHSIWPDMWKAILECAKELGGQVVDFIQGLLEKVITFFQNLFDNIKTMLGNIIDAVVSFISNMVSKVTEFLSNLVTKISEGLTNIISKVTEFFTNLVSKVTDYLQNLISKIVDFFSNVVNKATEFFSKVISKLIEFFSSAISKLTEFISNVISRVAGFFSNVISRLSSFISESINKIATFFSEVIRRFALFVSDVISKLVSFFSEAISRITQFIQETTQKIVAFFNDIINKFTSHIQDILTKLQNLISDIMSKISSFIEEAIAKVKEFFSNLLNATNEAFNNIVNTIKGFVGQFMSAGKAIFEGLFSGIKEVWGAITSWVSDKISWLGSALAKAKDMLNNIKSAVSEAAGAVSEAASNAANVLNGSHANGLDYVPFDGYVAKLHEGERVLTRNENEEYSKGGSNGNSGDTYNFYNTKPDPREYARQMKQAKKELLFN